jgi:hypothetical protein
MPQNTISYSLLKEMRAAEPPDASSQPFPCFACGGETACVQGTRTRKCAACDIYELRHTEAYLPAARTVHAVPAGPDKGLPYLDHSRGHYPSPA